MEDASSSNPLPLGLQLRTTQKALRTLTQRLGVRQTAALAMELGFQALLKKPFGRLPPPKNKQEALTRKQAAPAILLYRALERKIGQAAALTLTRRVTIDGAVDFLGHAVGPLDRAQLSALSPAQRTAYVHRIGRRFFNATVRWDEVSDERVRFTVTHCLFPPLCRAVGTPEIGPLFCAGDAVYFGEVISDVELIRPHTLAGDGPDCPFEIRWKR